MLRKTLLYGSLSLFSVLLGVFIGGSPGALRSSDAVPSLPATTTTSTTTTTTAPQATTTTTVAPEPSTTTTEAPTTTVEATTTTTEPLPELVGRDTLRVAVANGSGVQGLAGRLASELSALEYVNPDPINADRVDVTTVFHGPDFELEARRLAEDAGFEPDAVAPIEDLPGVESDADYDLVLLLGTDNQPPPIVEATPGSAPPITSSAADE